MSPQKPLLTLLQAEAVKRGLIAADTPIDAALAFTLVRDMRYQRASSRDPETTIREWRGTCSGKHYLLKALFAELGLHADLMACTVVTHIDPATVPPPLAAIVAQTENEFVDVHNYLVLRLPEGDMVVDATWPLATKEQGFVVNETFRLGESQRIAGEPRQSWMVPEDIDPQAFKQELLRQHFSPKQLEARDAFIETLSRLLAAENDEAQ